MALIVADRVMETTTTTGTGALALAAAITGYRRFSAVCATSDTFYYAIQAVDSNGNPSGDWECGLGTYSNTNELTRTTVQASSNAGAAVNFGAGTKYVFLSPTGTYLKGLARQIVPVLVTDPNSATALTTGDGKAYFRVPSYLNGYNLVAVAASVSTVSSSGTPTIQLRRKRAGSDVDMLSTKITIDASEVDSSTAAAAAVINTSNDDVATADQIYIDVDVAGTDTKGLNVEMTFELP